VHLLEFEGHSQSPNQISPKKLLTKYKPEFCFVAEPMTPLSNFYTRWLNRLGFKVFSISGVFALLTFHLLSYQLMTNKYPSPLTRMVQYLV